MASEKFLRLVPYLLSTGLSLAILLYAWKKRSQRGARAFFLYMVWEMMWLISYTAGLTTDRYNAKVFWDGMKWVTGLLAIITIPYFVTSYLNYKIRHPWLFYGLLSIIPILFILAIFTDNSYHLMYINPELTQGEYFTELSFELTWVILTVAFYAYVVALGSFIFLAVKVPKTSRYFRSQLAIIIVGGLMPILGTMFAIGKGRLLSMHDLSPFFGGGGNLILAWGLFRFRVFEFLPIAREIIVDTMEDAVIVLDKHNRIVDLNKQAFKTLRMKPSRVIGKPVDYLLRGWPQVAQRFEKIGNFTEEVYFEEKGEYYHYDVRSTLINSQDSEYLGRIFVARDVTSYARLQWNLEQLKNNLEERVKEQTKEITESYETTLEGWAKALELRDKETEGHSRRVVEETIQLARALEVLENDIVHIHRGAILHDIGKMAIPDDILRKKGELTADEWVIIKKHPEAAYELLKDIPYLTQALEIPYCHHEHWDGSGYPRGLKGEEIPLAARIFAVVDVWDALLSDRGYRAAWAQNEVVQYIKDNAGKLFDSHVVEVFLRGLKEN